MALLELIKMQAIKVSQDDLFSDIQIEKYDGNFKLRTAEVVE